MSEAELDVHLSKCTERYIAALQDVPRLLYHQLLLYHSVAGTEDAAVTVEHAYDSLEPEPEPQPSPSPSP